LASTDVSHFFEPVQLDFQLTDLLVELVGQRFLFLVLSLACQQTQSAGSPEAASSTELKRGVLLRVAGDLIECSLALVHFLCLLRLELSGITGPWGLHADLPFSVE
jgi:hypothetical protein